MYSFGHDQTARKFFKRREAVHGELALKARAELDGSSRWVTWPLHSQADARLVGPFLAEGMWRSGARTASDIWSRGEGVSGSQSQGTPGWAVFEQTTPPIPPLQLEAFGVPCSTTPVQTEKSSAGTSMYSLGMGSGRDWE